MLLYSAFILILKSKIENRNEKQKTIYIIGFIFSLILAYICFIDKIYLNVYKTLWWAFWCFIRLYLKSVLLTIFRIKNQNEKPTRTRKNLIFKYEKSLSKSESNLIFKYQKTHPRPSPTLTLPFHVMP